MEKNQFGPLIRTIWTLLVPIASGLIWGTITYFVGVSGDAGKVLGMVVLLCALTGCGLWGIVQSLFTIVKAQAARIDELEKQINEWKAAAAAAPPP